LFLAKLKLEISRFTVDELLQLAKKAAEEEVELVGGVFDFFVLQAGRENAGANLGGIKARNAATSKSQRGQNNSEVETALELSLLINWPSRA